MSWIKTITYEAATGTLKKLYDRVKGPDDNIDNILMVHSLKPHTLQGHMSIYKNVLHHSNNELPKWFLETIGVYVSWLNNCDYCVQHHFAGLKRLLNDEEKAAQLFTLLKEENFHIVLEPSFSTAMPYVKKLTQQPQQMEEQDVVNLKNVGLSEGAILEINQVTSYFNYANRTVLGLGVHTQGDILGLSPNNNNEPDNWNHS